MALSHCDIVTSDRGRELTEHGTAPFPLACYEEDVAPKPVSWHWHDDLELIAVMEGVLELGVSSARLCVRAGEGAFVNAGVLHELVAPDGSAMVRSVVFHPRLVGGSVDSVFWQRLVRPLAQGRLDYLVLTRSDAHRAVLAHALAAWEAVAADRDDCENRARYELSCALRLVVGELPSADAPSRRERVAAERVKTMLSYVEEHFSEPLTVADVARSALVSESICVRSFKRLLGTTPIHYVRRLRVEKAAALLLETGLPVGEVGLACGFTDVSYFTQTFRELKGTTPTAFRAQSRR